MDHLLQYIAIIMIIGMKNRISSIAVIIRIVTALLACMALFSQELRAEIYSYVDSEGVIHFSNVPTSRKYRYIGPETSANFYIPFTSSETGNYDPIIQQASKIYNIRSELIKAVIHAESNFNPKAVSSAGACGLMQLMPDNIERFNVRNPFDPQENVMAGACYLRQLMDKYDSDLTLTLAAYNAGPGAVDQYQSIPPYPETENYVGKVLKYYNQFKSSRR